MHFKINVSAKGYIYRRVLRSPVFTRCLHSPSSRYAMLCFLGAGDRLAGWARHGGRPAGRPTTYPRSTVYPRHASSSSIDRTYVASPGPARVRVLPGGRRPRAPPPPGASHRHWTLPRITACPPPRITARRASLSSLQVATQKLTVHARSSSFGRRRTSGSTSASHPLRHRPIRGRWPSSAWLT